MWLFSKYGFFSVVAARTGFGEPTQPIDPDVVMVRSRTHKHLERLKDRFNVLGNLPIESFPGLDYPCRLFVRKTVWADVAKEIAEEIDYGNFKAAVANQPESGDYEECLHAVWGIMRRLENPRKQFG